MVPNDSESKSVRSISNMANLLAQLFKEDSLTITSLKPIVWEGLSPKMILFCRLIIQSIFKFDESTVSKIFSKVYNIKSKESIDSQSLHEGLIFFLKTQYIQKFSKNERNEEQQSLRKNAKLAINSMRPVSSIFEID